MIMLFVLNRQSSGKFVLWPYKLIMAQPFDCAII